MTQEEVIQDSADKVLGVSNIMFFSKLASFGIKPQTQEEACGLVALGAELVSKFPQKSPTGIAVKSAAYGTPDRYAAEVNKITEDLCRNPDFMKHANIVMAAQNL